MYGFDVGNAAVRIYDSVPNMKIAHAPPTNWRQDLCIKWLSLPSPHTVSEQRTAPTPNELAADMLIRTQLPAKSFGLGVEHNSIAGAIRI